MFTDRDRQKCQRLFERYYAGRKFYDAQYRDRIYEFIRPGMRVLDAGCGRRLPLCRELSGVARMVGLDLERDIVADNRDYPFGIRGDVTTLPFAPATFDMIVSRSVIEHLPSPLDGFREFARVLKPSGILIIVTPNKYDYVSFVAHLTPHRFHQRLCSWIFNVSEDDVFPTFYRANTTSAIRKVMSAAGLVEKSMTSIAHYPAYLSFSPALFRLGVLYERLTSTRYLSELRGSILCVFEKPAPQPKLGSIGVRSGAKTGVS